MKNKRIGLIIVILFLLLMPFVEGGKKVEASTNYVNVNTFIKTLVIKMGLSIDMDQRDPYISVALKAGILTNEDFSDYTMSITRTDAAVLLNRADEYLHGDTLNTQLLNIVLKKRISDIMQVPENKRNAVAKCFAKGIIKGYFNGYYVQNRKFKGNEFVNESSAKALLNCTINQEKRYKISPDGELIRTTNLPKNAVNYDYILACYPNKFYERKFEFMFSNQYISGRRDPEHEIYPSDMKNSVFRTLHDSWSFSIEMDKYLYDWQEKAERYLNYIFNVNYKTVDNKWINGLASCYVKSNIDDAADIRSYYIKHMKANKVIIESSIISVEPSTLYYDNGYCMRAYVRYRILAKDINVKQNRLLWSQYPALNNIKNGVWREGIFDIRFGTNDGSNGDGSAWAMDTLTNFVDVYNVPIE